MIDGHSGTKKEKVKQEAWECMYGPHVCTTEKGSGGNQLVVCEQPEKCEEWAWAKRLKRNGLSSWSVLSEPAKTA